MYKTNFYFEMC